MPGNLPAMTDARPSRLLWGVAAVAALTVAWACGFYAYRAAVYAHGWEASKSWYGEFAPLYMTWTPEAKRADRSPPFMAVGWACALAAAGLVAWQARRATRVPVVLLASAVLAMAINYATARIDGPAAVDAPFRRVDLEYYSDASLVGDDPVAFLADYPRLAAGGRVEGRPPIDPDTGEVRPSRRGRWWAFARRSRRMSHHARTHPPGGVLTLWAIGRLLDPTVHTAALAAIGLAALSAVPAWLLARELAGRAVADVATGLYLVTPSLVLFGATCMDGVFLLPIVTAMWLHERSCRGGTSGARVWAARVGWAVLAGLAATGAVLMTFAASVLGVFWLARLVADAIARDCPAVVRRVAAGVVALVVVALAQAGLWATTGYDVLANLRAAQATDLSVMGTGHETLARYFDVSAANGIAFLIGGGVVSVALATFHLLRGGDRATWAHAAAFAAVACSTLFTLETERVWLFLFPLLAVAAARPIASVRSPSLGAAAVAAAMGLLYLQAWAAEVVAYTWW